MSSSKAKKCRQRTETCSCLKSSVRRPPSRLFGSGYIGILMPSSPLTREQAIERILASEQEIRALGVQRLALFGSVVRGEARMDSDVDLLVQFCPGAETSERFLALCDLLEARLGHPVELVTVEALSPFLGPRILAEAENVLRAA